MISNPLAFNLLRFYGSAFPYHPGKGRLHNQLLRLCHLKVDQQFDVQREGLRWRLNPADFVQASLFWLGRNDHYDLYNLQLLLKPDSVFFDIGANYGYYSVSLASRLGKQCQIHAFEPNPQTFELLRHHVASNQLQDAVHTYELALSDQEGTAALATKAGNSGGTHVVACEQGTTIIHLTTLDKFCDEGRVQRIDAMKIDVEGCEERVLLGGQNTLRRLQPILVMELEPPRLKDKDSSVERVASLVADLGYRMYVSHRRELRPLTKLPDGDQDQFNVFCLPEHSSVP